MRLLVCLLCAGTIGASGAPAFGQNTGLDGGPDLEARAAAYHAFILGRSLEGAGDVDGAVDAYRRASELDAEASDAVGNEKAIQDTDGIPPSSGASSSRAGS